MDMPEEQLVYLYCVTAKPPELEGVGDRPDALYLVCEAGLHAVVCRVEAREFGESNLRRNLDNLGWVAVETTNHERIIEGIMRDHCVIPFRFATLFKTDDSLRAELRAHGGPFRTLLEQLDDKAEWGVKAYCDFEKLERDVRVDSTVSSLDEAVCTASPGKAFLLRRKRRESAKAARADKAGWYAEQIVEALQPISVQARTSEVVPQWEAEGYGEMILNAAFLVCNGDARAFVDATSALGERYAGEGIFIECSGPWPPYNFCDPAKAAMDA